MVDLKKVTLPPPPPNCTKCQIFKILDQKKKKSVLFASPNITSKRHFLSLTFCATF